jgi:hypothetical protein
VAVNLIFSRLEDFPFDFKAQQPRMIVVTKTIRCPVHVSSEILSRQPLLSRSIHVTQGVLTTAKGTPEINYSKPVVIKKKFSELPKCLLAIGTESGTSNDWSGGLDDLQVVRRKKRKPLRECALTSTHLYFHLS